jgi:hypothetical protein
VPILYDPAISEADDYARQFWGYLSGIVGLNPSSEIALNLDGVRIWVNSTSDRPLLAYKISEALTRPQIVHTTEAALLNPLVLTCRS